MYSYNYFFYDLQQVLVKNIDKVKKVYTYKILFPQYVVKIYHIFIDILYGKR